MGGKKMSLVDLSEYTKVRKRVKFKRGWNVCEIAHLYRSPEGKLIVWDYPVLAEINEDLCDFDKSKRNTIFPCSLKCLTNKEYIYMENCRTSRQGLSHTINISAR